MRIAMPVHEERVSPVFDDALRVRLTACDISSSTIQGFGDHVLRKEASERVAQLVSTHTDVLICSAISQQLAEAVRRQGIKVISGIRGTYTEIILAFINNHLQDPCWQLPCWRRPENCTGRRRRHGRQSREIYNDHQEKSMLVAISSQGNDLDASVDAQLGRAGQFLLIDPETREFTILDNRDAQNAGHGAGLHTAELLLNKGIQAVIAGDCGPKALEVFLKGDVSVFRCPGGSVKKALEDWKAGKLEPLTLFGPSLSTAPKIP
ncbi:MAG: NifB/NifX family molybdenum-iron cluster-binding protein [Candidatus Ozemobacteraceae bacterium]